MAAPPDRAAHRLTATFGVTSPRGQPSTPPNSARRRSQFGVALLGRAALHPRLLQRHVLLGQRGVLRRAGPLHPLPRLRYLVLQRHRVRHLHARHGSLQPAQHRCVALRCLALVHLQQVPVARHLQLLVEHAQQPLQVRPPPRRQQRAPPSSRGSALPRTLPARSAAPRSPRPRTPAPLAAPSPPCGRHSPRM